MVKTGAALISIFLVAAAAGTILVNSAFGNPYSHIFPVYSGEVTPRSDTQPPKITIFSPENNSTFNTKNVSVSFKVEVGESKSAESKMISDVYYKTDWLENNTYVYEYVPIAILVYEEEASFSSTLNLTDVPEGRHSVIVYATERGTYYDPPFSEWPMWALEFEVKSYGFQIVGGSTFSFVVDVTPLNVTVLPMTGEILSESGVADVPLNFTVNGSASKISYALDGQENVTISGNTTLAGLSKGLHNVIVYAWDNAGNVGASEAMSFRVAEPGGFPTVPVVAVSSVSIVVVIAAGLLLVRKNRNRKRNALSGFGCARAADTEISKRPTNNSDRCLKRTTR